MESIHGGRRLRNQGLPLEDVVNKLYELRERTRFWAVIATLKNLMRIALYRTCRRNTTSKTRCGA